MGVTKLPVVSDGEIVSRAGTCEVPAGGYSICIWQVRRGKGSGAIVRITTEQCIGLR